MVPGRPFFIQNILTEVKVISCINCVSFSLDSHDNYLLFSDLLHSHCCLFEKERKPLGTVLLYLPAISLAFASVHPCKFWLIGIANRSHYFQLGLGDSSQSLLSFLIHQNSRFIQTSEIRGGKVPACADLQSYSVNHVLWFLV